MLHKDSPTEWVLLVKIIISRELYVENKKALWYTLVVFVDKLTRLKLDLKILTKY